MTEELRRALMALRLEVAKSIVDDIEAKVERGLTEAWKEGIDEMRDAVVSNENPILLLWDDQCTEVEAIAERLKEQR